jgi:RNA polymerase sigma-70 factor (ECF subfamily)
MRVDLVERARTGDPEAFGLLASGEVERLLMVARLVLRDRDLADDAVQETLVRCWRYLPTLRDVDRFEGWLNRILMRAITDETKRRKRIEVSIELVDVQPSVGDGLTTIADREQLDRGFQSLSVDHRAVVVLHHYLGLSMVELANVLTIPEGTAKSRYHYAMSALRAALEADARVPQRGEVLA